MDNSRLVGEQGEMSKKEIENFGLSREWPGSYRKEGLV